RRFGALLRGGGDCFLAAGPAGDRPGQSGDRDGAAKRDGTRRAGAGPPWRLDAAYTPPTPRPDGAAVDVHSRPYRGPRDRYGPASARPRDRSAGGTRSRLLGEQGAERPLRLRRSLPALRHPSLAPLPGGSRRRVATRAPARHAPAPRRRRARPAAAQAISHTP